MLEDEAPRPRGYWQPASLERTIVGMTMTLPPSLRKDLHTAEEDVAWARTLTPEQRLEVVASLCRDAMAILMLNPKSDRVLSVRDPLPESTVRALARLHQRR